KFTVALNYSTVLHAGIISKPTNDKNRRTTLQCVPDEAITQIRPCINHISENVLYKIRNLDFLNNQFYALHNLMKVYGDTGQTNASTFLWSLAKHPTRPNTYMIHNFDRSDHTPEAI
uniref:Uncharacterized protein n=1 Tax=Romanomermis culicivorax TaxID=13658 RepID=A0A915HVI6_ROMCU